MPTEPKETSLVEMNCDNPKMIADLHISLCFDRIVGMENVASPKAARRYVEQLLAEAKRTDDPIESMMIQQLVMAHHRVANLYVNAATAKNVDACETYSAMAQRLLAEFRRLALALREYRSPATGKQTTVVHRIDRVEQLNHAEGTQDVSYAKAAGPEGGVQMKALDSEVVSNEDQEAHDGLHETRERRLEESQAGCCGTA